jgi:hypothetical protein
MKDDLAHLLLKDVKGQFTLWEGANMKKISWIVSFQFYHNMCGVAQNSMN